MKSNDNSIEKVEKFCIQTSQEGSYIIPELPIGLLMDEDIIKRIPINRDEKRRVTKVKNILKNPLPVHREYALFIVKDKLVTHFEEEKIEINPGVYLANGNTRRLVYKLHPEFQEGITTVTANVYKIETGQDLISNYNAYDSVDSVESGSQKLQGAVEALKLNVSSTVVRSGGFKSALDIAYSDNKADVFMKTSVYKKEIELLDGIGFFEPADKDLKFQAFYAFGLIAAKHWGTPDKTRQRMISGLQKLARIQRDDPYQPWGDKWDGLSFILYEIFHEGITQRIPLGMLKKTSYATIEPQLDFFLYMFEKYMLTQLLHKKRGAKADNWSGKLNDILSSISNEIC